MKKLRIGILTHNYPLNSKDRKDAGIFIYDFAHELSKSTDVFIFCPDFGDKKEHYKKVPVTWFKWDKGSEKFGNWKLFNPIYLYKFFKLMYIGQREAIKFARKNKIDYCLCCWAIPSAIFGLRIKQKLGIRYASWSLGSDVNKYLNFPILGQLIFLSLKSADDLFANSLALCKKIEEKVNKKCKFMPAITNFELNKISSPYINKKNFNFLYVGRLEKVKGPDILVEAISLIPKHKKIYLNILGSGTMLDELKEKSKNFIKMINFVGWADEAMVGGYMKKSDCLIISSRNESLPLVMIEAAKVGLPVIATKVGDCERLIKEYKIGLVVEKEDPKSLAHAMVKISKDKIFRKDKTGFKMMTADFSQGEAVKIFLAGVLSTS